jgi:GDP-4-dehydro-6-deoxy-D-mannose reductase
MFNLVGPGQDERHVCGRIASQLATLAVGGANGDVITGDLSPTRDFVDVRDVANALITLGLSGRAGEAYNIGSGEERTIFEVFDVLRGQSGLQLDEPRVPTYRRLGDVQRVVASVEKLLALGYERRYPFETSLADLFTYYYDLNDTFAALSAAS